MRVKREEVKKLEYINDEHRKLDALSLSEDNALIDQIKRSREDREQVNVHAQETGLKYLRSKIEEFESGQKI